jgi:hypothetical protein
MGFLANPACIALMNFVKATVGRYLAEAIAEELGEAYGK